MQSSVFSETVTLTAAEATGELDVVGPVLSVAEFQILVGGGDGGPGLETAVAVHVEAEEGAVADGEWEVEGGSRGGF